MIEKKFQAYHFHINYLTLGTFVSKQFFIMYQLPSEVKFHFHSLTQHCHNGMRCVYIWIELKIIYYNFNILPRWLHGTIKKMFRTNPRVFRRLPNFPIFTFPFHSFDPKISLLLISYWERIKLQVFNIFLGIAVALHHAAVNHFQKLKLVFPSLKKIKNVSLFTNWSDLFFACFREYYRGRCLFISLYK